MRKNIKLKNQIWKSTKFIVNDKGILVSLDNDLPIETALFWEYYINDLKDKK
jgi:hypothetical protein